MAEGEPRGNCLRREPLAPGGDDREPVADRHAVEEDPVVDVLRWMEQTRRLASLEQLKDGLGRLARAGVLAP